jgi:predicted double-glycine peptidase
MFHWRTRAALLGFCLLWEGLGLTARAAVTQPSPAPLTEEDVLRKQMSCGPNSLYLLLKLWGRPVPYGELEKDLPVEERGISMLQLRDAAQRHGLRATVCRYTMDELQNRPLPLIAHFPEEVAGKAGGHYVVVVKVVPQGDERGVWFIDGTNGQLTRFRWERFPAFWSGYVLEPADSFPWRPCLALLSLSLWAGLCVLALREGRTARRGSPRPGGVILALAWLGGLWAFAAPPPAAAAEQSPDVPDAEVWRRPGADGLNCLYLQLRLLGHGVDYRDLDKVVRPKSQPTSLATLEAAAGRCGLPARVRRCTPGDVATLPLPVIAHLDDPGGGGRFVLLFGEGGGKYGVIDGATATIKEVPADEFRRAWSGHVLVPDTDTSPAWPWSLSAGVLVLAVYAGTKLLPRALVK